MRQRKMGAAEEHKGEAQHTGRSRFVEDTAPRHERRVTGPAFFRCPTLLMNMIPRGILAAVMATRLVVATVLARSEVTVTRKV